MTDSQRNARLRAEARARADAFYGEHAPIRHRRLSRKVALLIFIVLMLIASVAIVSIAEQRAANNAAWCAAGLGCK